MGEHKVHEVNGCTVIDVAAAYTRQSFVELLEVVRGVVGRDNPRLVLNMTELPHITSEGIGLLVLVHDECLQSDGKMVLANVPLRVERVLKLAGVVSFFSIHPDLAEATAALKEAVPDAAPEPPAEPEEAEEPEDELDAETALRDIVSNVIRSRRHQQVIEFFSRRPVKIASLDEVSGMVGIPRPVTERVIADLVAGGIIVRDGELYAWEPSPPAEKRLNLFKRALSDPKLRSRVLAWVYAEEKKA